MKSGFPKEKENRYQRQPIACSIIVAEVLFGSPRNSCAGSGICKVMAYTANGFGQKNNLNCKCAIALVRMLPDQKVGIHFVKASMCGHIRQNYFGSKQLILPEAAPLALDPWAEVQHWLVPGVYNYENQGHFYTATIDITTKNPKLVTMNLENVSQGVGKTRILSTHP